MESHTKERRFFFALLILSFIFTIFVFRPFLTVLVIGASVAVVLYPLYTRIEKKVGEKYQWLASLLTVLFFLIVVCVPLYFMGSIVLTQSQNIYKSVVGQGTEPFLSTINDSLDAILPAHISFDIREKLVDLATLVSKNLSHIFTGTLSIIFSSLLVILSVFYFLKDGSHWKKMILALSPLSKETDSIIITRLVATINGVVKGYLLIALAQGTLMGIGLAIFGVPNPALWGMITGIASFIPTVGTALVSVPTILFLLATGKQGNAIGLTIWVVTIVGTIDNILSPIVIGRKIDVPPLLILFSVLGGISLLGPVGILIGPLSISLLYTLMNIYQSNFSPSSTTEA